jgi:formylglycine-generating enzyme required for sulfatase activity
MARELEGMRAADLMRQALIYAKPASRRIHGMEVRALIYAERAASSVESADRVEAEVAWSWALWAVGRGAEALDKLESLRDQLPPADRGPVAEDLLLMQLETARFTGDARAEREAELLAWKAEAKARRKNIKTEIATAEADLDRRIADLQAQCRERRTWRFLDPAEDALHAQFQATEAELVALATVLDQAQEDEVRRRWSAALQAIAASPKYAQARWPSGGLVQQLGLVPLGEDPHSGLWEFLHAGSGLPPARGDDGEWIIDGDTGLVFVLVPGGRTPRLVVPKGTANHQDEWVAEFELDPYFLSKYELTVGQWKRLAAGSAAVASSDPTSIAGDMPCQQPSWSEYAELLQRVPGPIWFPSRLQWEHAMRAGTNTMYWTGDSVDSLRGKENIKFDGVRGSLLPVGSLAANPYGFHDIIGSLVEMCGDAGATDDETAISEWVDKIPPRPGDGMKLVDAATHRLTVGSAYWNGPNGVRVAMEFDPNERDGGATLRPAMRVLP